MEGRDLHFGEAFGDEAESENAELFYADLGSETTSASVDPLRTSCRQAIIDLADASPLVSFRWPPNRGRAPLAYLRGMALTYARVYCKWKAGDVYALEMAKRAGTNTRVDALATFSAEFRAASMSNASDGVDTLRHVFVLLIGLGMMESSGRYNVGRDLSASNISSTTAEAGLFQISHSVGVGSSTLAGGWLKRHYEVLKLLPYSGLRSVFSHGRGTSSRGQTSGFRTDRGGRFRRFLIMEPALGAELAALGIRKRVRHWGPLRRRQVTINADCDRLLQQVQHAVDEGGCCQGEASSLLGSSFGDFFHSVWNAF